MGYTVFMLRQIRKYQQPLCRAVIVLFLLTGSAGAWAASTLSTGMHSDHCAQHSHAMTHHDMAKQSSHDCCKTQNKPCTKLCCQHCAIGGVVYTALTSSLNLTFLPHGKDFNPAIISIPDDAITATPYRPPQALLS
jgi:hypothetical protein